MSGSQVVDMDHWRARTRVLRPAGGTGGGALASRDPSRDPSTSGEPAAVLALPDVRQAPQPGTGGPVSPFGPVMAFGLLPREEAVLPAPPGEGTGAALTSSGRTPRARHLLDVRGTSRGPRR